LCFNGGQHKLDGYDAGKDFIIGNEDEKKRMDAEVAVTNNDKEVVEYDQGFWNLSEVGFLKEREVEGIELVVDLNPVDVVEDTRKGK